MAQVNLEAVWGADIRDDIKTPGDGSDWVGPVGVAGVAAWRVAEKFDISVIPQGSTITSWSMRVNCLVATGVSTKTWQVGCYGANGQDDPEADPAATAYARCTPGNDYFGPVSILRTPGFKTFSAQPSSQGVPDFQAALPGGIWSVAIRENQEVLTETGRIELAEYVDPNPDNRPLLAVVFTPPPIVIHDLGAVLTGTGAIAAQAQAQFNMDVDLSGQGGLNASLDLQSEMAATLTGQGGLSGDLLLFGEDVHDLGATLTGQGVLTGEMGVAHPVRRGGPGLRRS